MTSECLNVRANENVRACVCARRHICHHHVLFSLSLSFCLLVQSHYKIYSNIYMKQVSITNRYGIQIFIFFEANSMQMKSLLNNDKYQIFYHYQKLFIKQIGTVLNTFHFNHIPNNLLRFNSLLYKPRLFPTQQPKRNTIISWFVWFFLDL